MTTIKATCPECGEVNLTSDDIELRINIASGSSYGFLCGGIDGCGEYIVKKADERTVRLLLSGGVMPIMEHVPAEVLEPKTGPPINHDDLLAFHELLEREDWFDQLTSDTG